MRFFSILLKLWLSYVVSILFHCTLFAYSQVHWHSFFETVHMDSIISKYHCIFSLTALMQLASMISLTVLQKSLYLNKSIFSWAILCPVWLRSIIPPNRRIDFFATRTNKVLARLVDNWVKKYGRCALKCCMGIQLLLRLRQNGLQSTRSGRFAIRRLKHSQRTHNSILFCAFLPYSKQPFAQTAKPKPKPLAKRATNESKPFFCYGSVSYTFQTVKQNTNFSLITSLSVKRAPHWKSARTCWSMQCLTLKKKKKNLPQTAVTIGRFTTHNLAHFFSI